MNKRFWGLDELYRYNAANNSNPDCTDCQNSVPCLNTDYCTPTPRNIPDDVLTMAFINMQPLESVYPPETSFSNGTLFPNINKPFYGGMQK